MTAPAIVAAESGTRGRPRVGIVGVGNIAQEHALGYLAAGAEIVGIADVDAVALASRAAEWGVERTFADHRALLDLEGLDAISVCTPNAAHPVVTIDAAARGVHVLCEKPLALSLTEAEEMVAACRDAGVVLQVNHHLRSNVAVRRARVLIDEGIIGRICSVRLRQAHDWGGREQPPDVFRLASLAGGGTLLDNGCHLFDLARHLAGPVAEVFARVATLKFDARVEDTASVSMAFASGALGTVETAWTATGWEYGFWVYGTMGALECTNRSGALVLRHVSRSGQNSDWGEVDVTSWEHSGESGHRASVAAFLATLGEERPVVCSGEDGREAVRLVLASYESARLGRPVAMEGWPGS
jgi:predicted dehydrogenase